MTWQLRWPSTGKLFLLSIAFGAGGVVVMAAWDRHQSAETAARVERARAAAPSKSLAPGIDLAAQLPLSAVGELPVRGYTTVIDLRPDGEAADQAPSSEIAAAAKVAGLHFHYVPVPHGEIPETAVAALRVALDEARPTGPVLIYCRSGKRAARTWALVEAQRANGMSTDEIIQALRAAGQEADDLRDRLDAGVGRRETKGVGA